MDRAQIKQLLFAVAFLLMLSYNVVLVRQKRQAEEEITELSARVRLLESKLAEQDRARENAPDAE